MSILAVDEVEFLKTLSLEQLADIEVSIATRTPTAVADSAAAVFVVTADDIRRSGASSVPEALRMVPGLDVARVGASEWAITSRGFNGRYGNKLLVLVDGRTVYTPLFSGVYWNVQDTLLEDIERIEVVRGPGASVWGANAVNGVINIITRPAHDTRGSLASVAVGDPATVNAGFRHGGTLSEDADYRVYAKVRKHETSSLSGGGEARDAWEDARVGFRIDAEPGADDTFTLQGDLYRNRSGQIYLAPDPAAGVIPLAEVNDDYGAHLLGRWKHRHADDADSSLQVYYDYQRRDEFNDTRHTLDLDYQLRLAPLDRHELVLGAGYRLNQDQVGDSIPGFEIVPSGRDYQLFSAFIQDGIRLDPRWDLILGAKLEYNDFTGFEIQPSARLLWRPDQRQTLWASVSRAVRTPSRGEHDASALLGASPADPPAQPFPVTVWARANGDFSSESLIAYELGYRIRANRRWSLDMTVFYNDYYDLQTFEPGPLDLSGLPDFVEQPILIENRSDAGSYGLELAVDWRPMDDWRWQMAYSLLKLDLHLHDGSASLLGDSVEGQSPQQQLSLRTGFDPAPGVEADLWLRYVDELPDPSQSIDAYWTLDARLAWHPSRDLEISLVGQDLLNTRHAEFVDELQVAPPTDVSRGYYLKLVWGF